MYSFSRTAVASAANLTRKPLTLHSALHTLGLLLILLALATRMTASAQTNPKHFFWAPGQPQTPSPSSLANDLIYHGGNAGTGAIGVENTPATYLIFWGPDDLAREAARAVTYFHITDLADSQVVVATPQKYNDAGFNQNQYCAWHDYTTPISYPGVTTNLAFVNMPYVLNAGGGCGQDFVNPAPAGDHDGVTIVLGHEIAETLTDPGAESQAGQVQYGAWFDYQSWEIGDKCAWVGDGLAVPGSPFNMAGNDGRTYPVQALWSNQSLNGVGYCAQAN